jgi:hypothetical protein
MSFKSVLDKIGEDLLIGFEGLVKIIPKAETLAKIIFPEFDGPISVAAGVITTVQKAVVTVEQKYAQAPAAVTGEAKLAEALEIITPQVVPTLQKAGVEVTSKRLSGVVNAVVGIMNAAPAPAAKPTPAENAANKVTGKTS